MFDLNYDKKNHDRQLNSEELILISDIKKIIDKISVEMNDMAKEVNILKSINFYEIGTRDLPKHDELRVVLDIMEKNTKISRLLNELTSKIFELYKKVNKELF